MSLQPKPPPQAPGVKPLVRPLRPIMPSKSLQQGPVVTPLVRPIMPSQPPPQAPIVTPLVRSITPINRLRLIMPSQPQPQAQIVTPFTVCSIMPFTPASQPPQAAVQPVPVVHPPFTVRPIMSFTPASQPPQASVQPAPVVQQFAVPSIVPFPPPPLPPCSICNEISPGISVTADDRNTRKRNEVVQFLITSSQEHKFTKLSNHLLEKQEDILKTIHLCKICSNNYIELSQVYQLYLKAQSSLVKILNNFTVKMDKLEIQSRNTAETADKQSTMVATNHPEQTSQVLQQEVHELPITQDAQTNRHDGKQQFIQCQLPPSPKETEDVNATENKRREIESNLKWPVIISQSIKTAIPGAPLPETAGSGKDAQLNSSAVTNSKEGTSETQNQISLPSKTSEKSNISQNSEENMETVDYEDSLEGLDPASPADFIEVEFEAIAEKEPTVDIDCSNNQNEDTVVTDKNKNAAGECNQIQAITTTTTHQQLKQIPTNSYTIISIQKFFCKKFGCRIQFSDEKQMLEHECCLEKVDEHRTSVFCRFCLKSSQFINTLRRHMSKKHPEKLIHSCSQCDKKYTSELEIETHKSTHLVIQGPYTCLICEKLRSKEEVDHEKLVWTWETAEALEKHLLCSHIMSRRLPNRRQKREFYKKGKMTPIPLIDELGVRKDDAEKKSRKNLGYRHLVKAQINSNSLTKLTCDEEGCSAEFLNRNQILQHKCRVGRVESNSSLEKDGRAYNSYCRYCLKCSQFIHVLTLHMSEKHSDKLTHCCSICNNSYTSELQLETHKSTHLLTQGPYTCLICQKLRSEEGVDLEKLVFTWETAEALEKHLFCSHTMSSRRHLPKQVKEFREDGQITRLQLIDELRVPKKKKTAPSPPKTNNLDTHAHALKTVSVSHLFPNISHAIPIPGMPGAFIAVQIANPTAVANPKELTVTNMNQSNLQSETSETSNISRNSEEPMEIMYNEDNVECLDPASPAESIEVESFSKEVPKVGFGYSIKNKVPATGVSVVSDTVDTEKKWKRPEYKNRKNMQQIKEQINTNSITKFQCFKLGCMTEFFDRDQFLNHTCRVGIVEHNNIREKNGKAFSHCRFCMKSSQYINVLTLHMSEKHQEKLTHWCSYCNNPYTSELQLETHKSTHLWTQGPYTCLICQKLRSEEDVDLEKLVFTLETAEALEKHLFCSHIMSSRRPIHKQIKEFHQEDKITPLPLLDELGIRKKSSPIASDCDVCGKVYPSKEILKRHKDSHKRGKHNLTNVCELCDKAFNLKSLLFSHILNVHEKPESKLSAIKPTSDAPDEPDSVQNPPLLDCPKCPKKFVTQFMFKNHLKFHSFDDQPHISCEFCDTRFSTRGQKLLDSHLKCVHGKVKVFHKNYSNSKPHSHKSHVCYVCKDKTFRKTYLLRQHIQSEHPEAFNQVCDKCPSVFFHPSHLETHKRIHSDGPYICSVQNCGRPKKANYQLQLVSSQLLAEHLMQHTGEPKKRQCAICSEIFFEYKRYKNHVIKMHPEVNQFKCEKCSAIFLEKNKLLQHVALKHEETYKLISCRVCNKSFKTRWDLHEHSVKVHQFAKYLTKQKSHTCMFCGLTMPFKEHKLHLKNHVFPCYFCRKECKTYDLWRRHADVHTKEKGYQCYICGQRFNKNSINAHINQHKKKGTYIPRPKHSSNT